MVTRSRKSHWFYDPSRQLYWCYHLPIIVGSEELEPAKRAAALVWTNIHPLKAGDILDWIATIRIDRDALVLGTTRPRQRKELS
jgi:hypothetical protein